MPRAVVEDHFTVEGRLEPDHRRLLLRIRCRSPLSMRSSDPLSGLYSPRLAEGEYSEVLPAAGAQARL
jgi:hypothetical protein